jgi:uncharacterized protein DUF1905
LKKPSARDREVAVLTKTKRFKAELQSGHQEDAVEVPFDPAIAWGIPAAKLWRGRKGHTVKATVNGVTFEGFIVARQRRFFLLVDVDIEQEAAVSVGDTVAVTITPRSSRQ